MPVLDGAFIMAHATTFDSSVDRRHTAVVVAGVTVLALALTGLAYYKWLGSWSRIAMVSSTGIWKTPADGLTAGGIFRGMAYYFSRVWIALVYGIVIGATVRALVSTTWIAAMFASGATARRQVTGGLVGAPLMLCSCCVTPIFTGVYERGGRLGSSLSLMLASPGLNPAALILTFLLFPLKMSLARLAAALVVALLLPVALERLFPGAAVAPTARDAAGTDGLPRDFTDFAVRFVKSLVYLTLITVPMIAVGVLLSGLVLPATAHFQGSGAFVALLAVAAVATLVALPTFFEIPLALMLLQMGLPGAATAILVAGPIVNTPSLLVLGRKTSPRLAASLAAGVWVTAAVAGIAVSF